MATARGYGNNGTRKRPMAEQRQPEEAGNQPIREFAAGSVKISIWKNSSRENGGLFYSTQVVRRYRDGKSGEWKSGNRFNSNELLQLALIAQEAFRWILANPLPKNQREPGEDDPQDVEGDME